MPLSITGELGAFEEFFSETVYPDWPFWLLGTIVFAVAIGLIAVRLGWHRWAGEHPWVTGGVVVALLAFALPAGYYTLSPLFERDTVCEASPISGSGAGSSDCEGVAMAATVAPTLLDETQPDASITPAPTPEAKVVARGDFMGADDFHFGEGQALLIETVPGAYVLRFENFSVRNGPDLYVYLSSSADGLSEGALRLGGLKGTDGAFNYEVPAGTDVSAFKSAVVWCDQFAVLFATAPLA
jgi:hypothetical protein